MLRSMTRNKWQKRRKRGGALFIPAQTAFVRGFHSYPDAKRPPVGNAAWQLALWANPTASLQGVKTHNMKSQSKSCFLRAIPILFIAYLGWFSQAAAQASLPDSGALKEREDQFVKKWGTYSEKADLMTPKEIRKNKASLETEYNALIDELDALYHSTPTVASVKTKLRIASGKEKPTKTERSL